MKIYQLHKYGGEFEEYYDDIIGTYLRKERAEDERNKAYDEHEQLRKQWRYCARCPLCDDWYLNDKTKEKCKQYCEKFKPVEFGFDGFTCDNYVGRWEEAYFRIEEEEVIE